MKNPLRWLAPARKDLAKEQPVENKQAGLSGFLAFAGSGNVNWSRPDYVSLATAGYMRNPVVHRCVRLIAQSAAATPLLAYEGKQELAEHPVLSLMRRPNARQAGKEFLETLINHLLVAGNAYVERLSIGDEIREIHALRPDRVKVMCDGSGWLEGYEYQAGTRKPAIPFRPMAPVRSFIWQCSTR